MMRYSIRDSRSRKKTKPRIFDVIVEDNGEMEIEVAGKKGIVTISLDDAEQQIDKIKQAYT